MQAGQRTWSIPLSWEGSREQLQVGSLRTTLNRSVVAAVLWLCAKSSREIELLGRAGGGGGQVEFCVFSALLAFNLSVCKNGKRCDRREENMRHL